MKTQEKKVLGIIAIVLGAIALLGSWMPIINNVSFIFAIIGLILGIIGLIVNRKRPKLLATIGTILSIVSMAIVLGTQAIYGKALDEASKAVDTAVQEAETSIADSQAEADAKFTWTKADFDALVVGDTIYGTGGANYDDIVAQFGEPQTETESTSGDSTSRFVDYNTIGGSTYKSVSLQFAKQADGTFLLAYKSQTGLE